MNPPPAYASALADAVAAILRIDTLTGDLATARRERDEALVRALSLGCRPSEARRATGLSDSMIRVIRMNLSAL